MAQLIKDKETVPAGGIFRYVQPESGLEIRESSWRNLVNSVRLHRQANGYAIPVDYEREVEEGFCKLLPEACKEGAASPTPKRLTIGQVISFTSILGESMLRGNPRCSAEVADERASICASCPDNIKPDGCGGCNSRKVDSLVSKLTGAKPTSHDSRLDSCRHCGCLNRAQVWFPLEILQKHTSKEVREALPAHCWKK
jgi:hypothetical protein